MTLSVTCLIKADDTEMNAEAAEKKIQRKKKTHYHEEVELYLPLIFVLRTKQR